MKAIAFIFAHPDDEFGCFESIRSATQAGNSVECYYLTDGGYGGQSTAIRKRETLSVLRKLGVAEENVRFVGLMYGLPDGVLYELKNMLRAADAVYESLKNISDIEGIYAPAWEGGHQDHDASFVIACKIADELPGRPHVWQYSLYNGYGLRGSFFNVMKPLHSNGEVKNLSISLCERFKYLRLCLSYRSQWKTWVGLFPFVCIKLLLGGKYCLQLAMYPHKFERPHAGALLYERRRMARFEDVSRSASRFATSWCNRKLPRQVDTS